MTIIQIGKELRINLEEIVDVSTIIEASTDEFDDYEDCGYNEEDWMDRFFVKTISHGYGKTFTITECDVPNVKETHEKLTALWLEFTNTNVIKL